MYSLNQNGELKKLTEEEVAQIKLSLEERALKCIEKKDDLHNFIKEIVEE